MQNQYCHSNFLLISAVMAYYFFLSYFKNSIGSLFSVSFLQLFLIRRILLAYWIWLKCLEHLYFMWLLICLVLNLTSQNLFFVSLNLFCSSQFSAFLGDFLKWFIFTYLDEQLSLPLCFVLKNKSYIWSCSYIFDDIHSFLYVHISIRYHWFFLSESFL